MSLTTALQQRWPLPSQPRPIVIVGAGGIVNDAHLPAYAQAGWQVAALVDRDASRLQATGERWQIAARYLSLTEAVRAHPGVVFDLALPPDAILPTLALLPEGACVLIQKPMGTHLAQAQQIVTLCRQRRLTAAINHQLRFAPYMLALREVVQRGWLGQLSDVEMQLNCADPWQLFPFLETLERVEIQVHSIHYLDLIRSLLGQPQGVYALTLPDPRFPKLKSTRSSIILNYGQQGPRVCLSLNHNYAHGEQGQAAMFKFEGSEGVVWIQLGVMLDYPKGRPDSFALKRQGHDWEQVALQGSWFPEAFVGPMANLQRYAAGEDPQLLTHVEDVLATMALVEACYSSSASGGTALPSTELTDR